MVDRKNIVDSASEQGLTMALEVASKYGAEEAKKQFSEHMLDTVADVASDAVGSFIPGVHGVLQTYKRKQLETNFKRLIVGLSDRLEDVRSNVLEKTDKQQEDIDKIFGYVLEYAADEPQVDKIEFFVNGFINITEHDSDSLTEDFVLTYYDMLKGLRLVDISVLRDVYYTPYFNFDQENAGSSYQDILEAYGIRLDQYHSVQNNLFRFGLLTTKAEEESTSDLEKLFKTVNDIVTYLSKVNKAKKRAP